MFLKSRFWTLLIGFFNGLILTMYLTTNRRSFNIFFTPSSPNRTEMALSKYRSSSIENQQNLIDVHKVEFKQNGRYLFYF